MGQVKRLAAAIFSVFLIFMFIQSVGGYLIGKLSSFQDTGQVLEQQVEEKVVRQMVLQLEPVEYYTVQVGSYQDASAGQAKINELAQLGYRVCVSQGPPYCLWLGCFGKAPQVKDLPQSIQESGSDVFVQKLVLNETALRFPAEDKQMMEQISSLLSSYDVVLKHSLQMFQDYRYEACSDENWQQMIQQLTEELTVIEEKGSAFLTMDSKESIASGILDLLTLTQEYQESLQLIQEKKTDKVVLLAQSCLLELIEQYHIFIAQESQMEIGFVNYCANLLIIYKNIAIMYADTQLDKKGLL